MATFKVKYSTRNKLARSLQQEIKDLGLVQEWTLYDSIRISAMTGDELNKINIFAIKVVVNINFIRSHI